MINVFVNCHRERSYHYSASYFRGSFGQSVSVLRVAHLFGLIFNQFYDVIHCTLQLFNQSSFIPMSLHDINNRCSCAWSSIDLSQLITFVIVVVLYLRYISPVIKSITTLNNKGDIGSH